MEQELLTKEEIQKLINGTYTDRIRLAYDLVQLHNWEESDALDIIDETIAFYKEQEEQVWFPL